MDNGQNDVERFAAIRNTGRSNLWKARFFVEHIKHFEIEDDSDIMQVEAYLDAAIVFGKATQDWIKDNYGIAWLKQSELWGNPLCKFFADSRDVIIHEDGVVDIVMQPGQGGASISIVDGKTSIRWFEPDDDGWYEPLPTFHFRHNDPIFDLVSASWLVNEYIDLLEAVLEEAIEANGF